MWGWTGRTIQAARFPLASRRFGTDRAPGRIRAAGLTAGDRVLSWRAVRTVAAARPRAPEGSRHRGKYQNVWCGHEQTLGRRLCAVTRGLCVRARVCTPVCLGRCALAHPAGATRVCARQALRHAHCNRWAVPGRGWGACDGGGQCFSRRGASRARRGGTALVSAEGCPSRPAGRAAWATLRPARGRVGTG